MFVRLENNSCIQKKYRLFYTIPVFHLEISSSSLYHLTSTTSRYFTMNYNTENYHIICTITMIQYLVIQLFLAHIKFL